MKIIKYWGLAAMVAWGAMGPAQADTRSFRCNRDIVKLGDSKASAASKCGEPVLKDSFCKAGGPQSVGSPSSGASVVVNTACEAVDDWTYNPGTGQFMTTLRFEQGVLTSITYGQRVK